MNAVTLLGRMQTHPRLQLIFCIVMAGAQWAATGLEAITSLYSMLGTIGWPPARPSTSPMLRPHRPDAPRIQLRLDDHVPASAGRADEALAGRRDGRVHRQAEGSRRNVALTPACVAIHPGELTVEVEVGEGDGLWSVGHYAAPNESNVRRSLGHAGHQRAAPGYRRPRGRVLLALGLTSR
jgi:hypothetical protein